MIFEEVGHKSLVNSRRWVYPVNSKDNPSSWCIRKKDKNRRSVYYGSYSYEMACLVRDKLIECNWDKNQLERIKTECLKELG